MSDFEAGQNSIIALIRQWATHNAKIGRHGTNRRMRALAAKLERERPVQVPMEPQGRAIPLVEDIQRGMEFFCGQNECPDIGDYKPLPGTKKSNALYRLLGRKSE